MLALHGHHCHLPAATSRPAVSRRRLRCHAAGASSYTLPPQLRDLGLRLADAAGEVIRPYFRASITIDTKDDASPVTEADRKAEEAMRQIIMDTCPSHEILGEEHGLHHAAHTDSSDEQGYRWVLDPIDGTKSFITGKPTFGTLIALLHKGVPVLGIIDQPISRERWVGIAGESTTLNGEPVKARSCGGLKEAYLYATSPHMFQGSQQASFIRVRDKVKMPLYGCDCYAYGLLAAGFVDVVVEATMQPYDYLALVPIIKGAGGVITDWQGAQLEWPVTAADAYTLDPLPNEVCAVGDPGLHQQVLELLAGEQEHTQPLATAREREPASNEIQPLRPV